MRSWMFVAVCLATACKDPAPTAPAATRFLPADPDVAFRLDVPRIRAWSIYPQLAPVALTSVETLLASAKSTCGLDVMGTATTIIGAKKDALMSGDLTLVIAGLPRDAVTKCLDTVAAAKSVLSLNRDGDLFHAKLQDRSIASGAVLPSGEVVVVARKGAGIDAAAWKTEVAQGAAGIPAWWNELVPYIQEPVAVRSSDAKRVILATANFTADTLTVSGKIITSSADDATREKATVNAIVSYFKSANANVGATKVEIQGATVFAELTSKGAEVEALLKIAGPALFGGAGSAAVEPDDGKIYTCDQLGAAVETYMTGALESMPAERKTEMTAHVTKIMPTLKAAYVDSCTSGAWANGPIACHVKNAASLPRFEKCRAQLTDAQREPFDKAVGAALSGS